MLHSFFRNIIMESGIKFQKGLFHVREGRAGGSPAFCFLRIHMALDKNKLGIFFSWWTVVATGIVAGLGLGFYMFGISALFKPNDYFRHSVTVFKRYSGRPHP